MNDSGYNGEHEDFEDANVFGPIHNRIVECLMDDLKDLHVNKSNTYKGSWAKRGYLGVFFTAVRPFDRIENIMTADSHIDRKNGINSRAFFDACLDVALYFIKLASTIAQTNIDIYDSWVNENNLNGALNVKPMDDK